MTETGVSTSTEILPDPPIDRRAYRHRARRFGRLVISTSMQAQGAPIVDRATTRDVDGNWYRSRAILLKPWKRGERSISARALIIGWRA